MRSFAKALAVSTLGLFLGGMAYAATAAPITTLTCVGSGGNDLQAAKVYAYAFGSGNSNPNYFSAYLSGDRFYSMLDDEAFAGPFSSCVFANNNGIIAFNVTILDVTSVGVGANVDAGSLSLDSTQQVFIEVDFSYTSLEIGVNMKAAGPVGTPEEQARAFQAFKAKGLSLPWH